MLRIPQYIREAIIAHAREGLPLEVCGILGGKGTLVSSVHRIRNTRESSRHFLMDPHEQIAAMESLVSQGFEILAFYHSHPAGPAVPSAEDIRLAFYPEVVTIVISLEDRLNPVLGAFKIDRDALSFERQEILPA